MVLGFLGNLSVDPDHPPKLCAGLMGGAEVTQAPGEAAWRAVRGGMDGGGITSEQRHRWVTSISL